MCFLMIFFIEILLLCNMYFVRTIAITIAKSLHECRHHDISTLNDHGQHKLDYSAAAQTNVRQRDAQVYILDMILLPYHHHHHQPTMPSLALDT